MPIVHRRCANPACPVEGGRLHDLISYNGALTSLSDEHADDVTDLSCPECGSTEYAGSLASDHKPTHRSDSFRTGGAYPYYNRGLQCIVESEAHADRLAAERGLVPVKGDIDLETFYEREFEQEKRDYQEWLDLEEMYKNHPSYKEAYHKMKERGCYKKNPAFSHLE